MKTLMLIFISLVTLSLNSKQRINQEATESVSDYDVQVVDFKQFQPLLHIDNDTIYVVNFWATWCAPCIREVPYFEQLREEYKGEKLKIIMVSLDFSEDLDSRVIPFMRKHNMQNEVILLDDPQSNLWIPLVDEKWTGAIPATLIYGNGFREFHAKEFTFSELDEIIESLISN
ncbi:MAG: TlpA disulfide reductase family protein [Fermentimonas sp.]|jgi:thiol-disulfide isomerase/thioredoxin|nr:TlpA disulfide reductase family protein [Fermentimonas sp.]